MAYDRNGLAPVLPPGHFGELIGRGPPTVAGSSAHIRVAWEPRTKAGAAVSLPDGLRRVSVRSPSLREAVRINGGSRIVECTSPEGPLLVAVMPNELDQGGGSALLERVHVVRGAFDGRAYRDVDVDLRADLGAQGVDEDARAKTQAAQSKTGGEGSDEDCDAGGDGVAIGGRGILVKRRCSDRALFGHPPTVAVRRSRWGTSPSSIHLWPEPTLVRRWSDARLATHQRAQVGSGAQPAPPCDHLKS